MKTKSSPILKVFAVLLTIALPINIALFGIMFYDEVETYPVEEAGLLSLINYGEYARLLPLCYEIEEELLNSNSTVLECFHIGMYYENAVLYKAYLRYDSQKAEYFRLKMNEFASQISEFQFSIEEINSLLEIPSL